MCELLFLVPHIQTQPKLKENYLLKDAYISSTKSTAREAEIEKRIRHI